MKEDNKTQTEHFYKERYGKPCYNANPRVEKVIKIFSEHKFNRILDIGCGDGSLSTILKNVSSAKEVYGVGISEEMFKCTSERRIKFFQCDIVNEGIPFEDDFFDAVFCGEVIGHLFDPCYLLYEIHRVLTDAGLCIITTPNLACWYNRIVLLLGYQPYYTGVSSRCNIGKFLYTNNDIIGHIRNFTYRSFLQLIKTHPFDVVEIHGASANVSPLFNGLDTFFSKIPSLSLICVIVARRKKNFFVSHGKK